VDEREGWAGDIVLRGGLKSLGNAFNQRRLAGTEVSAKKHDASVAKRGSKLSAQGDGFIGGVGDEDLRKHDE
jgi:hypothetical protein